MTREEFIKKSLVLGLGLPFFTMSLESCGADSKISIPTIETNFSGKVLIIGAGAAGLSAGYFLNRYNIDFQIIEASAVYGGRVKRASNFVDFPIDLGAEWIHTSPSVLSEIIDDSTVNANIDFITYNPKTFSVWKNGELKPRNFVSNFYSEYKFKDTTWYGFFEKYIVSDFLDKIVYNEPITQIDYSFNKVILQSLNGNSYEADKVLITVPMKVLQSRIINFMPALPVEKTNAIDSIYIGDGLKVFIEFSKNFYPDILGIGGLLESLASADKIFYDAAFRKDADANVMGLFSINDRASEYTSLATEQEIIDKIMSELDEIFDGQASKYYVKHLIQNWSKEPYILGAYSYTFNEDQEETVNTILKPLDDKIYFAGEALSVDNQATVHGACQSAYATVEKLLIS